MARPQVYRTMTGNPTPERARKATKHGEGIEEETTIPGAEARDGHKAIPATTRKRMRSAYSTVEAILTAREAAAATRLRKGLKAAEAALGSGLRSALAGGGGGVFDPSALPPAVRDREAIEDYNTVIKALGPNLREIVEMGILDQDREGARGTSSLIAIGMMVIGGERNEDYYRASALAACRAALWRAMEILDTIDARRSARDYAMA